MIALRVAYGVRPVFIRLPLRILITGPRLLRRASLTGYALIKYYLTVSAFRFIAKVLWPDALPDANPHLLSGLGPAVEWTGLSIPRQNCVYVKFKLIDSYNSVCTISNCFSCRRHIFSDSVTIFISFYFFLFNSYHVLCEFFVMVNFL